MFIFACFLLFFAATPLESTTLTGQWASYIGQFAASFSYGKQGAALASQEVDYEGSFWHGGLGCRWQWTVTWKSWEY